LLIATANAFVGLGEDVRRGANTSRGVRLGAMVECFLKEVHANHKPATPVPWDAAFVHHVGYWSHYDDRGKRSSWPLPATASVEELAQAACTTGLFRRGPLTGDLFLFHNPAARRFVRTGIIAHVAREAIWEGNNPFYECITIEGHTEDESLGKRALVLRHRRLLSPMLGDHFVRWTALDGREERPSFIEEELDRLSHPARAA
jgi:hypothetical protein